MNPDSRKRNVNLNVFKYLFMKCQKIKIIISIDFPFYPMQSNTQKSAYGIKLIDSAQARRECCLYDPYYSEE